LVHPYRPAGGVWFISTWTENDSVRIMFTHTHTNIYTRYICALAQSDLTSQAASSKLNDACVSVKDKTWSACMHWCLPPRWARDAASSCGSGSVWKWNNFKLLSTYTRGQGNMYGSAHHHSSFMIFYLQRDTI
jgi:hypothetical protein